MSFPGDHDLRHGAAAEEAGRTISGIQRLLAVAGGSMGGMQALEWAVAYPEAVACAIPIATTSRHSAQQIAFNEVGRQAIMADPDWCEGNYYDKKPPARGLAVARMVGHITYMSDDSMREKFGRRFRDAGAVCRTSRRSSKWRAIFAIAAASSSTASTRTRTSTSPRRWTCSIVTNGHGSLAAALEAHAVAFPGDQLHFGLAVSDLPVARDRERAARPQSRRGVLRTAVELRPRCVPGGRGRADAN